MQPKTQEQLEMRQIARKVYDTANAEEDDFLNILLSSGGEFSSPAGNPTGSSQRNSSQSKTKIPVYSRLTMENSGILDAIGSAILAAATNTTNAISSYVTPKEMTKVAWTIQEVTTPTLQIEELDEFFDALDDIQQRIVCIYRTYRK